MENRLFCRALRNSAKSGATTSVILTNKEESYRMNSNARKKKRIDKLDMIVTVAEAALKIPVSGDHQALLEVVEEEIIAEVGVIVERPVKTLEETQVEVVVEIDIIALAGIAEVRDTDAL